jgi:GNAT superfamily N-acetyltransferase
MSALAEHARLPIAFRVDRILDVAADAGAPGGFRFSERTVDVPYTKDYDAIESPLEWPARFDVSSWRLFAARVEGARVGGAVVAFDSPGLDMLEGRRDVALLWDIRVSPESRGRGVGSALFRVACAWAKAHGCRLLKAETQDVNVAACKFYSRQGCVLGTIRRDAYQEFPDEIQLVWHKEL